MQVSGEEDYLGAVDLRHSPPSAILFMPKLPPVRLAAKIVRHLL